MCSFICYCSVYNYLRILEAKELISIFNGYYSGLLMLSATFATVSGVFGLFRMQAISTDLTDSYNRFRNWIIYRIEHPLVDPKEKAYLMQVLKVDREPNSWLEKDVFDNIESFKERDRKNLSLYKNALKDYYDYLKSRIEFRKKLIWLMFVPFAVFVVLAVLSLFVMLGIYLFIKIYLLLAIKITFYLSVIFLLNLMCLFYGVWISVNDLAFRNFNNCKTNVL